MTKKVKVFITFCLMLVLFASIYWMIAANSAVAPRGVGAGMGIFGILVVAFCLSLVWENWRA